MMENTTFCFCGSFQFCRDIKDLLKLFNLHNNLFQSFVDIHDDILARLPLIVGGDLDAALSCQSGG